jgi:hypothetical protein
MNADKTTEGARVYPANADPRAVSPSGFWFAWYPVFGWDFRQRCRRFIWRERVLWFRPFGLLTEYQTYVGSEAEHHDKHGCYSWERGISGAR